MHKAGPVGPFQYFKGLLDVDSTGFIPQQQFFGNFIE
jgi:hypothetical protein